MTLLYMVVEIFRDLAMPIICMYVIPAKFKVGSLDSGGSPDGGRELVYIPGENDYIQRCRV